MDSYQDFIVLGGRFFVPLGAEAPSGGPYFVQTIAFINIPPTPGQVWLFCATMMTLPPRSMHRLVHLLLRHFWYCIRQMYHFSTDIPQLPGDSTIGSLWSRLGHFAINEVFSGNALYLW